MRYFTKTTGGRLVFSCTCILQFETKILKQEFSLNRLYLCETHHHYRGDDSVPVESSNNTTLWTCDDTDDSIILFTSLTVVRCSTGSTATSLDVLVFILK